MSQETRETQPTKLDGRWGTVNVNRRERTITRKPGEPQGLFGSGRHGVSILVSLDRTNTNDQLPAPRSTNRSGY